MTSVKPGVTVNPPCTALLRVTVKVIASPSFALASVMATVSLPVAPPSSSMIVPVAGLPAVTPAGASDRLRLTVKVSSVSPAASSVVSTVKVCVSPAAPVKVSADVFSV